MENKQELNYLEEVKEIINANIEKMDISIDEDKDKILNLKKFMWENFSDYTEQEMNAAYYEVDNETTNVNMQIKQVLKYKNALNSPYFGKVIFNDKVYNELMNIYIGITTIQKNDHFFVFDWRTPISSLFYNYEIGDASYETPNGIINGEIKEKMQFKIANGQMIRCFKSNLNIDDDYLQEILSNSASDKMKNIVSTIQREQNEIIRNDKDKYLIVQGIAGSGKTSVALHRIAYLMYKDKNLNSNNILIFSPNDVFSDYISNVLPELGEENVLKTTYSEFAYKYLKKSKRIEDYNEFLDRIYGNKELDDSIKYKLSFDIKNDLDLFYNNYINNISFETDIQINNRFISRIDLLKMFKEKYSKLSLSEKLERMSEDICYQLNISVTKYSKKVYKLLLENSNINIDFYDLYKMFLNSEYCKIKDTKFDNKKIIYEDITSLLYLNFLVNDFPNCSYIRQVVIDEAQDYTNFQMYLIKKIFTKSSFTILGDTNQTINRYYKYDSMKEMVNLFENSNYLELNKTYRSSEEIIDYTNKILELQNACSIRKNINIPVTKMKLNSKEIIEQLKKDLIEMKNIGFEKIAIITKNSKKAIKLYNLLSSKENIQLVSDSKCVVNNKVIIIPSYLSKGLEFDGVIIYNDSELEYTEQEKNLYYVVCTRAQHKLNIYNEPEKILKR